MSAGSGSRPICQWCCQTRLEAWSQVPCTIQWLPPEAAPQADSLQKSTFIARLGLYLSRKEKKHVPAKEGFQSARRGANRGGQRQTGPKKERDVPGRSTHTGSKRCRY